MKIRKNITISDTMLARGDEIAHSRGFDDFSEMVSALIREEHERRGIKPNSTAATPASDSLVAELRDVLSPPSSPAKGRRQPASKAATADSRGSSPTPHHRAGSKTKPAPKKAKP